MSNNHIQPDLPFEQPRASSLMSVGEIYDKADQDLLQELKEDRRIERKPVNFSAEALGIYFSMWANTPPEGGLIAIGMEDNGTISGCLKSPLKHINKSEAWIRLGDRKKQLEKEEINELEIDKGQIDFEQDLTSYKYPDDFNRDLIQQYANSFRKSREGRIREDITDEEILEIRHLGKFEQDSFRPNIACVLAFAKDPQGSFPGCKIRFLRFEGELEGTGERWNPIKDIFIDEGSIPLQIAEAEKVIESQLRTFTRLGTDNKFHTVRSLASARPGEMAGRLVRREGSDCRAGEPVPSALPRRGNSRLRLRSCLKSPVRDHLIIAQR